MTALGRFPALDLDPLGHAAPGAARRRRGRRGDRQGARRGGLGLGEGANNDARGEVEAPAPAGA